MADAQLGGIATEIRGLAQLQADEIISAEEFKKAKANILRPAESGGSVPTAAMPTRSAVAMGSGPEVRHHRSVAYDLSS